MAIVPPSERAAEPASGKTSAPAQRAAAESSAARTRAPAPIAHSDPLAATLARAVSRRDRVLARMYLPETEDFRAQVGALRKDKMLKQIERHLEKWHKLDAPEKRHQKESNDFDRIHTAKLIQADARIWLDDHLGSRPEGAENDARDAIQKLATNAEREVNRLTGKVDKRWKRGVDDKPAERLTKRLGVRDMHSAFAQFLAPAINVAAPVSGSKAEIEAEIEVAVDPNMIGFVGLRLKLEADRPEETKVKARAELVFTAGAKFPNLGRVRFEFGGYLEAQGRDATEVSQLVSYALYRTLRESRVVPREFVNMLWGGTWDSKPGYTNAERWAGSIETRVLGASDAYVESGLMAGAMGEFGVQAGPVAAKVKAQVQSGMGERWDKKSITTIHQEKSKWSAAKIDQLTEIIVANPGMDPQVAYTVLGGMGINVSIAKLRSILTAVAKKNRLADDYEAKVRKIIEEASPGKTRPGLGEASEEEARGFGQVARGERTFWIKASAEGDISIATMAIKGELNYISRGRDKLVATHFREGKVEGRFGVKLPLTKALGDGLVSALALEKATTALANAVRTWQTVEKDKKVPTKDKAARELGSGLRGAGDVAGLLAQADALKPFEWATKAKSPIDPGLVGFVTLGVIIEYKWKPSHSDGSKKTAELNIQIAEEKGMRFGADVGAFAARVGGKTQERWARYQRKGEEKVSGDGVIVWGVPLIDLAGHVWERTPGTKSDPSDPEKHWKKKK